MNVYVEHVKFWDMNIIFFSNALSTKIYAQNLLHGTIGEDHQCTNLLS